MGLFVTTGIQRLAVVSELCLVGTRRVYKTHPVGSKPTLPAHAVAPAHAAAAWPGLW